jgi:hypothetical protein
MWTGSNGELLLNEYGDLDEKILKVGVSDVYLTMWIN